MKGRLEFDAGFKPLLIYDTKKSFEEEPKGNSVHGFWQREGKLDFYKISTEEKEGELDIILTQLEEFSSQETVSENDQIKDFRHLELKDERSVTVCIFEES